jgi:hypothetical protein
MHEACTYFAHITIYCMRASHRQSVACCSDAATARGSAGPSELGGRARVTAKTKDKDSLNAVTLQEPSWRSPT